MKKITLILLVLFCNLAIGKSCPLSEIENVPDELIIPDVTIDDPAFYLDANYLVPTKLIFPNLVSVRASLDIRRNTNLIVIEAPLLEDVGGTLYIDENPDLLEVTFPKLRHVSANAVIVENPQLEHILVPELQRTGGDLHIYANPNLITLDTSQLQKICGGFGFHLNHSMLSLNLPNLISIGHFCNEHAGAFLHIFNNDNLEIVDAPNLGKVDFVTITNNPQLKKLNLCSLVVDEDLTVNNNNPGLNAGPPYCLEEDQLNIIEITDQSLENIFYHQEDFQEPTKLVFTNLTSVEGYIYFHQNDNLVEVDFPLLETTGGYVYFHQNLDLKAINAPNLTTAVDYLYVYGHSLLEQLNVCNLEEILPSEDAPPPYHYIANNTILIDENLCFELTEEEEEAENFMSEEGPSNKITIYPNPSDTHFHVVQSKTELMGIHLFDFSGNVIKAFLPDQNRYDVSDVPTGTYLMMIYNKNGTSQSKKIIIR
ncbi:T9SS type A sorting domain-containing protein [Flagellimonas sp.]|uniref:T9SS type A sorting domain-containing protein n=1 Tax=Flagellimonas sp. TaxID=2058762 RepID=UPI003B5CD1C2